MKVIEQSKREQVRPDGTVAVLGKMVFEVDGPLDAADVTNEFLRVPAGFVRVASEANLVGAILTRQWVDHQMVPNVPPDRPIIVGA